MLLVVAGSSIAGISGGILGAVFGPSLARRIYHNGKSADQVVRPATPSSAAKGWKSAGLAFEGQGMLIHGFNVWNYEWCKADQPSIELPHPSHPKQRYSFRIYSISVASQELHFAAAEVSAGTWAFYEPCE